jgi:stearoyl-CoA desaturase (delta-9 desaturase)
MTARTTIMGACLMSTPEASSSERINWMTSAPFLLFHLALLMPIFTGVSWQMVLLCVASYYLRMFGVTAGYHRYFSHRAYKTGRVMQFLLAFLAQTSAQKGALWWAANHRRHHKYSDTELDIHSPIRRGFWWSHMVWIMVPKYEATDYDRVKDLAKFPELVWLNRWKHVPPAIYGALMFLAFGWEGLLWGFLISTVVLYHGTFTINSLAHVIGRRRYETSDTSKNSFWLAVITMGEGWHNNHHYYQSTANQGWFWWEIDLSFYLLKAMSWVGLVRELRLPPQRVLDAAKRPEPQIEPAPELGLSFSTSAE